MAWIIDAVRNLFGGSCSFENRQLEVLQDSIHSIVNENKYLRKENERCVERLSEAKDQYRNLKDVTLPMVLGAIGVYIAFSHFIFFYKAQKSKASFKKQRSNLQNTIDDLKKENMATESTNFLQTAKMESRLDKLLQENSWLQKEKTELQKSLSLHKDRNRTLEDEVTQMKCKLMILEREIFSPSYNGWEIHREASVPLANDGQTTQMKKRHRKKKKKKHVSCHSSNETSENQNVSSPLHHLIPIDTSKM
ncbi:uncharacterized protein LOC122799185 [Protopterus annectens]|uniref:uncharacterized protein LOC122799185 n=1 Tax=Protopterus annectens TaxID=7888 RepID=UPI001CFADDD5|nr:uncharacterized protein LOC122799185 [Protopterus annectens]XP_043924024.1 uncharacterized protein LOC122799185 [Protopterus annectens]